MDVRDFLWIQYIRKIDNSILLAVALVQHFFGTTPLWPLTLKSPRMLDFGVVLIRIFISHIVSRQVFVYLMLWCGNLKKKVL